MSFFDSLKQSALDVLHATVNALHAQFAASLAQAGHPVTPDDHTDTLVQSAANASAKPGSAPTYADHALATFTTGVTQAMLQFAQQHMPAKFQAATADAVTAATSVANDVAASKPVDVSSVADTATKVAAGVLSVAVPGAAPIVALAEPLIESIEHAFEGGASAAQVATATVQTAAPVVEQAAGTLAASVTQTVAAEADKVLPGGGQLVGELVQAGEAALGVGSEPVPGAPAAAPSQTPAASAPDTTPAPNYQGM